MMLIGVEPGGSAKAAVLLAATLSLGVGAAGGAGVLLCGRSVHAPPASEPGALSPGPPHVAAAHNSEAISDVISRLGHDDYRQREQATQRLIAMGQSIEAVLQTRLRTEQDPEIRRRLRYVLSNIRPPEYAVLLISAAPESGLRPGDVITHVSAQPVRSVAQLRRLMEHADLGAMLRIRREAGIAEVGPVLPGQIHAAQDYTRARGGFADALRLYHGGYAERAREWLQEMDAERPIGPGEFNTALHACIALTAGDGSRAFELLQGQYDYAQAIEDNQPWTSPSALDRLLGFKAPFHLEWQLLTEAGPAMFATSDDPDLRLQRVLVPAGRYVDTLVRAAEIWWDDYRDVDLESRRQHVGGNMLAVVGWMFNDLGLRTECCRLIEPRSAILRRGSSGLQEWVRVDTDAWLAYLAGDEKAALDEFYEHALHVLQNPPDPSDRLAVIRNPTVASRIAFFLYRLPSDERVGEMLRVVAREGHPVLADYAHWMLTALQADNQHRIRDDLHVILPKLVGAEATEAARAVALLEYVQNRPQKDVLAAARQRIFDESQGRQRDVWTAIIDVLVALVSDDVNRAAEALTPVADAPEAAALGHTIAFRMAPPPTALNREALQSALLAVPVGVDDQVWLVLARDRRLLLFDARTGALSAIDPPTPTWFPNPLTWPWIGRDPASGRVWTYARRRVVEVRGDGAPGVRFNIRTADIPGFDRLAPRVFTPLAAALDQTGSPPPGEQGEFLRADVREHGEITSDPDLRELAVIRDLPRDPRVTHVAMRGGPHLLVDTERKRVWSGRELAGRLGLDEPLVFFVRAQPRSEPGTLVRGHGPRLAAGVPTDGVAPNPPPILWLFSAAGLLRFDTGTDELMRMDLPGDEPAPPVIPESVPYDRRDERFVYCARLPSDGGQVYRVTVADGRAEILDMVNEALPPEYYRMTPRGEIRARIDAQFAQRGMGGIQAFMAEVENVVLAPQSEPE